LGGIGTEDESPGDAAAVTVTCRDDADATVVTVRGEMDIASVDVFDAAIAARRPLARPLRLDLSGVTFFDSSAVRALLQARRIAIEDTGSPVEVVAASPAVRTVLELAGLADTFE
jgi:anti-sigma B factor antagonist